MFAKQVLEITRRLGEENRTEERWGKEYEKVAANRSLGKEGRLEGIGKDGKESWQEGTEKEGVARKKRCCMQ